MNAAPPPRPLRDWPLAERSRIQGVITDIDDTLTEDGQIQPHTWHALHRLQAAGLSVVAVTGRPVGWSQALLDSQMAAQEALPLQGVVAENGAVALRCTAGGTIERSYRADEATRQAHFQRLQAALLQVETHIAGARRASDSWGRETDIAIDHSEHQDLTPAQIEAVRIHLQEQGLRVSVSSIHINAWLGEHNKWTGAQWALDLWLGRQLHQERERWVYIGDSSNDELMFQHLPHTVGVANLARFLPTMDHPPRYICQNERGRGFAEMVAALFESRI